MADTCCRKVAPSKTKTVLFVPLDCVGHVNSLISIADYLKQLGHRTVFLFYDPMDGGLKEKGHEVYDCSQEGLVPSNPTAASELKWDCIVAEMGKLWRSSVIENFEQTTRVGLGSMAKDIKKHEKHIERKLNLIEPDLIIIDHYFMQPALKKYGKPWARINSSAPLILHKKASRLPPATLGLPTNWLDTEDPELKATYENYQKRVDAAKMELYKEFNEYLTVEHKLEPLPTDPLGFIYDSPYLNVYIYPEELDYKHLPVPDNWVRCDSILRCNANIPDEDDLSIDIEQLTLSEFEIPAALADKPGKLILLSMGSLASGDVALMKRLIDILADSPHRFIVSRGPNWQQYELAANMWGEKFLPQLSILPKIDLIITHGGNNTITECFYYGVPGLVVCPIFADQYDNAQRVQEMKFGKRVDPFHCSREELLGAVEELLADESIKPRIKRVSERMQRPENKYKAIRLFRDLVQRI